MVPPCIDEMVFIMQDRKCPGTWINELIVFCSPCNMNLSCLCSGQLVWQDTTCSGTWINEVVAFYRIRKTMEHGLMDKWKYKWRKRVPPCSLVYVGNTAVHLRETQGVFYWLFGMVTLSFGTLLLEIWCKKTDKITNGAAIKL